MSNIIEVTGTQPLVTVDDNVSNVSVVNESVYVTVESAVAVGNTTIRNALGAIPPIWYDKQSGTFGFIDRDEVVRSEKMVDAASTPIYGGASPTSQSVVSLDAEQYDIFTIQIAGRITGFDFSNANGGTIASGQTVTIICSQSTTPGYIDTGSDDWANWFWTNNNNQFPMGQYDTFMIKVLYTGNTYYASLIEFDTVMPDSQVGIPVGPDAPVNAEPGWLWYRYTASEPDALMIMLPGSWGGWTEISGSSGGASVHVGDEPGPPNPEVGDLWFNTSRNPDTLQVYNDNKWNDSEGLQGPIGYTGSQGIKGPQGFDGSSGNDGDVGFTGSRGDKGFNGSRGFNGSKGFDGSKGFNGSKGDQGIIGFTGSKGDIGFTGSASTAPGLLGFTGSKGDIGFTGSASTAPGPIGSTGFTGSRGYTGNPGDNGQRGFSGSQGFTGSQGPAGADGANGTGAIDSDVDPDGKQYARVRTDPQGEGFWEEVVSTGGGGDWDGILYDKPAVIQQRLGLSDFNQNDSGIQIGKNGFDPNDQDPLIISAGQHNNLVLGRNTYIRSGGKNITLLGSDLRPGENLIVSDNTMFLGNPETQTVHLGATLVVEDESFDKYGSIYDVTKISPSENNRDLVITTPGSIILANNTGNPDQGIQINASRLRYRSSLLPGGEDADTSNIRREIYFDATNILSSATNVEDVATEDNELSQQTATWNARRQLNYISPERIRFRKFAECVNYQRPDSDTPGFPNQSYADTDMDIDLHRGTIQHKILTDNVININITDQEWTSGTTFRAMGPVDHQPEPGTSITIIMYHQDALRTIAWPDNFKFLGGDSALTTDAGDATTQNINGVIINNIAAIDMLHSFYDGQTWWSSITRGYA